jgi:hypothetical protein
MGRRVVVGTLSGHAAAIVARSEESKNMFIPVVKQIHKQTENVKTTTNLY